MILRKEVEMAEIYTGEIRNGVVVLEGSSPPLPEGTKVRVEVAGPPDLVAESSVSDPMATTRAWLLSMAGEAETNAPALPPDLAEDHDYYARGRPRS
jgi:hypothetical protein